MHRDLHVVPPSVVGDGFAQIIGAFKSGRTAMLPHHIGTSVEIKTALGDNVGVMTMPEGPNGSRWSEASVVMHGISPNCSVKDAAFEFISWMSEDWAVEHQSRYLGSIPITRNVSTIPYFAQNQFYSVSNDAIPFSGAWPKYSSWGYIVGTESVTLLQRALMGEITAEEMVANLADLLAQK